MFAPDGNTVVRSLLSASFVACFAVSVLAQNITKEPLSAESYYAPVKASCRQATEPFVRRATALGSDERFYVYQRKRKATMALSDWLENFDDSFLLNKSPTLALAISGGGYRSMLIGAGVVQGFDGRDSDDSTNGLYQALTYQSGLSGGSWLLSSLAGNDFDTVSTISDELWEDGLIKNSLTNVDTAPEVPAVKRDLLAKAKAGYSQVTTDAWGRLLSYQLLRGEDGGAARRLSGVRFSPAFVEFEAPFPIITALGVENIDGSICDAADNATQYEFTPYEFGSWDAGVRAFTPTEFLGTKLVNGRPLSSTSCTRNFDNLGYILGTSSSKFNEECGSAPASFLASILEPVVKPAQLNTSSARRNMFAPYPNPFKQYAGSPKVNKADELYLVDGGQANQNNPIWPLLQPARAVDVLLVNDNSADTDDNWPNGTEILHTYNQAQASGLTRMPFIPSVETFVNKGLNRRATVFGCEKRDKLTIIYLPNVNYTSFAANPPSAQFDYTKNDTRAMISHGNLVATQNNDQEWPVCLGCIIAHKSVRQMPGKCKPCLQKYCFKQ